MNEILEDRAKRANIIDTRESRMRWLWIVLIIALIVGGFYLRGAAFEVGRRTRRRLGERR